MLSGYVLATCPTKKINDDIRLWSKKEDENVIAPEN
jgi:hypothetical protein